MDTKDMEKFIETIIKETDIEELYWESGETKISFKRSDVTKHEPVAQEEWPKPEVEKKYVSIKSPMVGKVHLAPSSDHPPLVIVGNHIVPGQKVAIIEAMKIMRDVISSIRGKVVKILVEDGQAVEYGQELLLIDTQNTEK